MYGPHTRQIETVEDRLINFVGVLESLEGYNHSDNSLSKRFEYMLDEGEISNDDILLAHLMKIMPKFNPDNLPSNLEDSQWLLLKQLGYLKNFDLLDASQTSFELFKYMVNEENVDEKLLEELEEKCNDPDICDLVSKCYEYASKFN